MRDLLTGLAIILIVALTTALVAPYLVDWNGQRAFLEARLSHALGQKVTIGGNIDLKLLPTPYLVLDQTVIGGDDGPVRLGIRHLDLELSVTPLLHGEFDIVEAQLRDPTLRVTLDAERRLPALPPAPAYDADLKFDRIEIKNGTIAVADPVSGRTFVADHLDLTADAPSLGGPFKGDGAAGAHGARTTFHFATTKAEKGRARARLSIEETAAHAGLDLDGLVTLSRGASDVVAPSFAGQVALTSRLRDGEAEGIAWRLSGPVEADTSHATLAGGELRLGGDDAGLSLQADGRADLGGAPHAALTLTSKQLDIDRLAGAPTDATAPPPAPPKLPSIAMLRRLVAQTPPLPLDLDVSIDAATWAGASLHDLAAHLALGGGTPQPLRLSGYGPGGLHVAVDGRAASGADGFAGTLAVDADDAPTALKWLATIAPDLPIASADVPVSQVAAKGRIVTGADGVAVTDLALTLDRSELAGTARLAYATTAHPAKLTADVTAKTLDLDALPSLDQLRGGRALDLDLKLDAKTIKVTQVGNGALDAGRLRLALTKAGSHLTVTRFRADDLGGATIAGTASLDADAASFAGTIDAGKLGATADLVKQLVPGAIADAFAARAATLAPAKLQVTAIFAPDAAGHLAASRLDADGHLAATEVQAHLAPDPQQADRLALKASATAPDGSALLSQLGFETLPLDLLGKGRVDVRAAGKAGEPLDTTIDADFGAAHVGIVGRFDWLGAARGGSGTFSVKAGDVGPLLQSLALAFPDMTGRIPVDVGGGVAIASTGVALSDIKGTVDGIATNGALKIQPGAGDQPVVTGALDLDRLTLPGLLGLALGPAQPPATDALFSNLPFTAGLVDPPRSALRLKAKRLDLGIGRTATDAVLDLAVAPNVLGLHKLAATLDGGKLTADATLRRDGNQTSVEAKIGAAGVAIRLPSLTGTLTGHLDLAGGGASSLALVSSLAGSGDATLADTTVPGADPAGLPHVFDAVESDDLAVDQQSVVRALAEAVRGPLALGPRRFRLGLAQGSLRWDAAEAAATTGAVTSELNGTLDLRNASVVETTTQTLRALPKNWTGAPPSIGIIWSGPLTAPTRSFDVSNFLDAVAARALAREAARVEAYEFDIRERAFFNARLQADRRRADDRDEEARKAEAARLAAEKAKADADAAAKAGDERGPELPTAPDPGTGDGSGRFPAPPPGAPADPSAAGRY